MNIKHEMNIKLGANLIFVSDLERAKSWYENIFGMETVQYKPPEFLQMKLGANTFYIETKSDKRAEGFQDVQIGGRSSMVFAIDNIQEVIRELKQKNVKVIVEPVQQFWGDWNAVIADPDGNEFILDDDK